MDNLDEQVKGYIESFKDGMIRGWVSVTHNVAKFNQCNLFIDDQFIAVIDAIIYREDLKDAGVREGCAGFLVPVPLAFCDNQEHQIKIQTLNNDLVIDCKQLKLLQHKNLTSLSENIVFDRINTPFSKQRKVMFLAGFTNQRTLLNYQKHFVQTFKAAGYYVVYILASDSPENLTGVLHEADRVIVRRNFGYDFGSWAAAMQLCQKEFLSAKELIYANDSIIGPINSMETLLKKIQQSDADVWAITDSQDRKYHFQSYFWGIKKKANQFAPVLDAFFFYRNALPQDKDEAISDYELQGLGFFKDQGLSVEILFPEHSLVALAEERFCSELQVYMEKWQPLLGLSNQQSNQSKKGKKTESASIDEHIGNLAKILINRYATNPSHMYWNILVETGFPFVKRELITLNPSNYPFPYQFRQVFVEHNAEALLDDLATAYKLTRIP